MKAYDMFQRIKASRICDTVAKDIEEAVISGQLKPGDKLPAERELVHEFGISRRALREALRILEQKGLVEMRTGIKGGAFIKDITSAPMSENLAFLIRFQKVSLQELTEFRGDLEGLVASRAAQRATDEEVAHLKELLREAEALVKTDPFVWRSFMDVDRRVHNAIAASSHNQIHEFVLRTVHDNIFLYFENYLRRDEEIVHQNYRELEDIVAAVEQRDPKRAFALAEKHARQSIDYMREAEEKAIHSGDSGLQPLWGHAQRSSR
jgi:DNA-binding FadR family transcriptional regulator